MASSSAQVLQCSQKSVILNVGGPVWALAWCPKCVTLENSREFEFLAVGIYPASFPHVILGQPVEGPSSIQVWALKLVEAAEKGVSLGSKDKRPAKRKRRYSKPAPTEFEDLRSEKPAAPESIESRSHQFSRNESTSATLSFTIEHNGGLTKDLKWRPACENQPGTISQDRLGYLAAVTGDGSVAIYDVPLIFPPTEVQLDSSTYDHPELNLKPIFSWNSKLPRRSLAMVVEWATAEPYDEIAVGFHDGTVAVWKVTFDGVHRTDPAPALRFSADSQAIRALVWCPFQPLRGGLNHIVVGGHKGNIRFWDLRDPFRPLWENKTSSGWILAMDWLQNPTCLLVALDDGTMRLLPLQEILTDIPFGGSPAASSSVRGIHTVPCRKAALWDLSRSALTGQVAYCSADGTVSHFQLSPQWVERKFPARAKEPHFVIGDFCAPVDYVPAPSEPGITPEPKTEPPTHGMDVQEQEQGQGREQAGEPLEQFEVQGGGNGEEGKEDMAEGIEGGPPLFSELAQRSLDLPESEGLQRDDGGAGAWPRQVAVHRVKWNSNPLYARWVAFGGVQGIVHCQMVDRLTES